MAEQKHHSPSAKYSFVRKPSRVDIPNRPNAFELCDELPRSAQLHVVPSQNQLTPPTTPIYSNGDYFSNSTFDQPSMFHNFLRATHTFNPNEAENSEFTSLEFNEGDLLLVHSIHTSGWADGTILTTGKRRWYPTNFFRSYEPQPIRNLLIGILNFWEQLQYDNIKDKQNFPHEVFSCSIIAGVRYLLEETQCVSKNSGYVVQNEEIRRLRRLLLSGLSSLIRNTKLLQELVAQADSIENDSAQIKRMIDVVVITAFHLIIRGAKFLDSRTIIDGDYLFQNQSFSHSRMNSVDKTSENYSLSQNYSNSDCVMYSQRQEQAETSSLILDSNIENVIKTSTNPTTDSISPVQQSFHNYSQAGQFPSQRVTQIDTLQSNQQSISYRNPASVPAHQRQKLISIILEDVHSTLLSYLGSFIGRLHLQSRSPPDLLSGVKQFVRVGNKYLTLLEEICNHENPSSRVLSHHKNMVKEHLQRLEADSTRIIGATGEDETAWISPEQKYDLLWISTLCVRVAGESFGLANQVLASIGDFEFVPCGDKTELFRAPTDFESTYAYQGVCNENSSLKSLRHDTQESYIPTHQLPSIASNCQKPLPNLPDLADWSNQTTCNTDDQISNPSTMTPAKEAHNSSIPCGSEDSSQTVLINNNSTVNTPTLPKNDSSNSSKLSPEETNVRISFTTDSSKTTNDDSNNPSVGRLRNSETSTFSFDSTRATTPDQTFLVTKTRASMSDLSLRSSSGNSAEESEETESRFLKKTFAHELIINKDGAIIGGTLPALVERLTINDSTPDSNFVTTFYLTFRLFVSPEDFATSLVDRFEYAGENIHTSCPVRLRVFNAMKCWLELYWRDATDRGALKIIEHFATTKLHQILPGGSLRLLEIIAKLSSNKSCVNLSANVLCTSKSFTNPRVSGSIDAPTPNLVLSKSASFLYKSWKTAGSQLTILDFDPTEVARQLSIRWMKIFCAIQPAELLGTEWVKATSNSPNIKTMVNLATDLSIFVSESVLHFDEAKKRALVIKQWIKIAHKCLELNNYDTLMAILCGVNTSTVVRLKKTWGLVSQRRKDLLTKLLNVFDLDNHCSAIRRRLQEHKPPCVPFLGIYLTDLTLLDVGNSDIRKLPSMSANSGSPVINFYKYSRTVEIIHHLQRFQTPYQFNEVSELQDWLSSHISRVRVSPESVNEQEKLLYRKSLLLEPRETCTSIRTPTEGSFSFTQRENFNLFSWALKDRSGSIVSTVTNG